VYLYSSSTANESGSTIANLSTSAGGHVLGGAVYLSSSSTANVSGSTISFVRVSASGNAEGGAFALYYSSIATLGDTLIERCDSSSKNGSAHGGAVFVDASIVRFSRGTALRGNTVSAPRGHSFGSTLWMQGSQPLVEYVFPVPPGTWLAATECKVDREPCPAEPWEVAQACEAIATTSCPYIARRNASVQGVPCPDATFFQPCRWWELPDGPALLGRTIFSLPPTPVEQDFPYDCSPGLLASANMSHQLSPFCAGLCGPQEHRA